MRVTFKTLADIDLEAAEVLICSTPTNVYNTSSLHSRQSVEKHLKYLLAESALAAGMKLTIKEIQELLKSHNIPKLMFTCLDVHTDLYKLKKEILDISDIYFKINYPGSDFMFVTKDESTKHLDTAKRVRDCCEAVVAGRRY